MLFGVQWIFGTICVSQVAYHRSLSGCPLKMKHGFLITDWHFWQSWPYSCVSPFLHSLWVSLSSPSPPLQLASLSFFSISLTHTSFSVSLHLSWLTAIRHWPCSLCLLPLPRARPSHNYFLWFTVVGHCHPPKVFTAEITHTVFSNRTHLHHSIILHLHYVQRLR